jgi:streptogramin lyase
MKKLSLGLLAAFVLLLAPATANARGNSGTVSNFTDPTIKFPWGIVSGPDSALWFTDQGNNSIGRITTSGTVSNYTDPTINTPYGIAKGPDGALWFANFSGNSIGRITTAGSITNYTDPTISAPTSITAGPDGALWFTNHASNSIGRITITGTVTNFTDPTINIPTGITAGSDGALWFTNYNADSIGRITTSGTVTAYSDPSIRGPGGIIGGPDSALWFTNSANNSIGRITTSGAVTNHTDPSINTPTSIIVGSDGALWFNNVQANSIGRMTTAGMVTNITDPSISGPETVAAGADGAVWFTNFFTNSIGRISTTIAPSVSAVSPNAGPLGGGQTVTITGTGFVPGATVKFGSTLGTNPNVVSATQMTVVAPKRPAGAVNIHVTTAGGTSAVTGADKYMFGAPTITTISPNGGRVGGGTVVTIHGTNFVPGTTVAFGANPATSTTYTSSTTLHATAPAAAAGIVDVTATTAAGTSATTSSDQYVFGAPSVTTVSPNSGPLAGGQTVTITGTGFVPGATVKFGPTVGTNPIVVSPTQMTVVTPASTAGPVNIHVTTRGGTSATSSADKYTYS